MEKYNTKDSKNRDGAEPNHLQTIIKEREAEMRNNFQEIPRDLAFSWLRKFEDAEDDNSQLEVLDAFDDFMTKRMDIVSISDFDIHPDLDEESRKEIVGNLKRVVKSIREAYKNPELFLGNGATAEVYSVTINRGICVKYINNQEKYNENNHLRTEYGFLNELHDFELNNIRTPKPYFLRIHRSEGHAYGMEKINGNDLSQVLAKPEENMDLIKILKELEPSDVIDSFTDYVKSLHTQYKITHNDIALRNIMIDKSGNFFLIDFGKSRKEEIGEDLDILKNSDVAKVKSELTKLFTEIDKIEISYTI